MVEIADFIKISRRQIDVQEKLKCTNKSTEFEERISKFIETLDDANERVSRRAACNRGCHCEVSMLF